MAGFALDVRNFVEKTKRNNETVMRAVSLKLFSSIIKASPVDTGRFRMNWQTSGASPATGIVAGVDPTGASAISAATNFVTSTSSWQELTLTNNLPYANVIEFGGYPSPVLKGTYNSKTKKYEIRSVGGFSKQAPSGVVRVNVLRFQQLIDEEAAKVR